MAPPGGIWLRTALLGPDGIRAAATAATAVQVPIIDRLAARAERPRQAKEAFMRPDGFSIR
jgi:hypothetical protein